MRRGLVILGVAALLVTLGACATDQAVSHARLMEREGNWDQAVVLYAKALENNPDSVELRLRLEVVKRMASKQHLIKGRDLWEEKSYEQSLIEYRTAIELDPLNRQAMFEFKEKGDLLDKMIAEQRQKEEWQLRHEQELKELNKAAEQKPAIDIDSSQTQSFNFPNREVKEIYQALAKMAGINIVFHESVRQKLNAKTDFIVNNATFWDAFDYFVTSNNHFYRQINGDTLMILDGSPNVRKQYEDLAVKVFFLSNAEVRDVFLALRTLVPGIKIQQNKTTNSIIVRDSPQKLAMIAKIIDILDKPKAEVIIDIEILEVDSTLLSDLGILLSSYASTQTFVNPNIAPTSTTQSVVNLSDLSMLNKTNLFLTIPDVTYNFMKTRSNSRLLAKPQLRITEGEKSNLHIGERVPVRKTTFNPNAAAGIGTPVDSYEYENVGIKFDITPRVHHNQEISLELDIDISAISAGATSTNPTFTTRNVKSKIRLRDGETNLLAGLIREEEKDTIEGIAGLADIPVIGRLFSSKSVDRKKTDIIITLTPHIVRGSLITLDDLRAIEIGPEVNLGYRGSIAAADLENVHFLKGVPLRGRGQSFRVDYYAEDNEDYYYDEDEEYNSDEEEQEPQEEPPPHE
jgi:general secretion pathway protein D